jgi:hypothetical protein
MSSGLLALSILSGGALAVKPRPRAALVGLPIWGVEAQAMGYQIPLPFGIGVTAYSAKQPVNIKDLQLGRNGNPPVSVKNFLVINEVDTTQKNLSAKLDVLSSRFSTSTFSRAIPRARPRERSRCLARP